MAWTEFKNTNMRINSASVCPDQSVMKVFLLFPTKCIKQYIVYIYIKCDKSCKQCPLHRESNFIHFRYFNNLLMNRRWSPIKKQLWVCTWKLMKAFFNIKKVTLRLTGMSGHLVHMLGGCLAILYICRPKM